MNMWKQHNNKMFFYQIAFSWDVLYTIWLNKIVFILQYAAIKSDYFLFVLTQKGTWEGSRYLKCWFIEKSML